MENRNFLSDEFRFYGTDKTEFDDVIADLGEHTMSVKVRGSALKWYCQSKLDGTEYLVEVPAGPFSEIGPEIEMSDAAEMLLASGFTEEQIQNLFSTPHMYVGTRNNTTGEVEIIPCHPSVTVNMAFTGISGPALGSPNFGTVTVLRSLCENRNITLVMRTDEKGGKNIITIRSEQYMPYDQSEVIRPVNQLGGKLVEWVVENTMTRVAYRFERVVRIPVGGNEWICRPEVEVSTSDSGDGSICYRLFWRNGIRITLAGYEISRRHRGKITQKERDDIDARLQALVDKAGDLEKLFADLNAKRFYGEESVTVFKNLLEDNKHFKAYCPRDTRRALVQRFSDTYAGRLYVTGAEIVSAALSAPDNIANLTAKAECELVKAAGEFPFMKLRGDIAVA